MFGVEVALVECPRQDLRSLGTDISISLSQLHSHYSLARQECGICGQLLETEGVESEDNTERGIYAVILSLLLLFI